MHDINRCNNILELEWYSQHVIQIHPDSSSTQISLLWAQHCVQVIPNALSQNQDLVVRA